jgi:hypothetical protein
MEVLSERSLREEAALRETFYRLPVTGQSLKSLSATSNL